jgi:transcriptional regulator
MFSPAGEAEETGTEARMYVPPAFAISDCAVLHQLIRTYPFAVIAGVTGGAIQIAYAPTLFFEAEPHPRVQFHLARANPLASVDDGASLTLSFLGPHAYISPNWYRSTGQVPTWNYIAVEGVGRVRRLDGDDLRRQLEILATQQESRITTAEPWSTRKLGEARLSALLDAISGFEVDLTSLEGKLKLSQNKSRDDIAGAIAGLEQGGDPLSLAVAAAMRKQLAHT